MTRRFLLIVETYLLIVDTYLLITDTYLLTIDRGKFAESNAELVHHVAGLCEEYDRPLATPQEAREILGLASTPSSHDATFAPPSIHDEPHESSSTSYGSQRPRQYMVM